MADSTQATPSGTTYDVTLTYSDGSKISTQVIIPRSPASSDDVITSPDGKQELTLAQILELAVNALTPADIGKSVAGLTSVTLGETESAVLDDALVSNDDASEAVSLRSALIDRVTTKALAEALASYLTSDELAAALKDYITEDELNTTLGSFVTSQALAKSLQEYVTANELATVLQHYVTASELTTALKAYVTSDSLTKALEEYVTSDALTTALKDYVTSEGLTTALEQYVTTDALTTALKSYVTSDSLAATLKDYATSESVTKALESYVTADALKTELEEYVPTSDVGKTVAPLVAVTVSESTEYVGDEIAVSYTDSNGDIKTTTLAQLVAEALTTEDYGAADGVPRLNADGSLFELAKDEKGTWFVSGSDGPAVTTETDNDGKPTTETLGYLIGKLFNATQKLQDEEGLYAGDLSSASITGSIGDTSETLAASDLFGAIVGQQRKGAGDGYVPTQEDAGYTLIYPGNTGIAARTLTMPALDGRFRFQVYDPAGSMIVKFPGYGSFDNLEMQQVYISAGDILELNAINVPNSSGSYSYAATVLRAAGSLVPGTTKPTPTGDGSTGEVRLPGDGYRYDCIQGSASGFTARWIRTAIEETWT